MATINTENKPGQYSLTIHYDEVHDIAYIKIGEDQIVSSKVISDSIWADFGPDEAVVGIQFFDAKQSSILGKLLEALPDRKEIEMAAVV